MSSQFPYLQGHKRRHGEILEVLILAWKQQFLFSSLLALHQILLPTFSEGNVPLFIINLVKLMFASSIWISTEHPQVQIMISPFVRGLQFSPHILPQRGVRGVFLYICRVLSVKLRLWLALDPQGEDWNGTSTDFGWLLWMGGPFCFPGAMSLGSTDFLMLSPPLDVSLMDIASCPKLLHAWEQYWVVLGYIYTVITGPLGRNNGINTQNYGC